MATIISYTGKGSALTGGEYDNALKRQVSAKVANHTVAGTDNRDTIEFTSAPHTVTLPDASTLLSTEDTGDFEVTIKNNATTGYIKIAFDAGDTLEGVDYDPYLGPGESLTLKCGSGTDDWLIIASHLNHEQKNIAFNGSMRIWQDGTTKAAAATASIIADGWKYHVAGAAVCTVQKSTTVPTAVQAGQYISNSIHVDVTTADAAIASTDYVLLGYRVEGYDAARFGFGQAGVRYLTVSFWFRSTITGTYSFAIRNAALNRSYVTEFTVSAADTWEKKIIIIPNDIDITATWDTTSGIGLDCFVTLMSGSDRQTAPNTWTAGNYFCTNSSPANAVSSTANNIYLTAFDIKPGGVATPFSEGTFAEELAKCQRYYEKSYPVGTAPGTVGFTNCVNFRADGTNGVQYTTRPFSVVKAAAPTITSYNPNSGTSGEARNNGVDVSCTLNGSTNTINAQTLGGTTTDNGLVAYHFVADATL